MCLGEGFAWGTGWGGEKTMTYFQNNLFFKILQALISENK